MKIKKLFLVLFFLLTYSLNFAINIGAPAGGGSVPATAESIEGFLNTRFGALFPSGEAQLGKPINILLMDFSPNTPDMKEALEKWNKRVEEWKEITTSLKIASNKKTKYQQYINRLKKANDDIIDALSINFKNNIYPAVKVTPDKYKWGVDEIDYNLINGDNLTRDT